MSRAWVKIGIFAVAIPSLASAAGPASPFPKGYEAAYAAYLAALPPEGRKLAWLTRLQGVASQPATMTMGGKPVVYLFACQQHQCDLNSTNIFLMGDRKQVHAVIKIKGVQKLIGGAGAADVACVKKLDANGGVATSC